MSMRTPLTISAAVEGLLDEAVICRLITYVGCAPGTVYVKNGKGALRQKLAAYNRAAQNSPWVILVDLDNDYVCAPALRRAWLPNPAPRFRVAVREVEAWLMADSETLANFLDVSQSKIPANPEAVSDAKLAMVNLARTSRRRDIQEDMPPRPGSGRAVGPAYTSRLIEYTNWHWRPGVAAQRADSLRRALDCLRQLCGRDNKRNESRA